MSKNLQSYRFYLTRAVKFYDLKNEKLTKTVFLVILLVSFLSSIAPDKEMNNITMKDILINIAFYAIAYIASTIYLVAFLRELKNKEYTAKECYHRVMKKAGRIIIASMFFGIVFFVGLFALIIPGMIFAAIYLLYICYIVDLGESISDSFSASKRITRGYRKQIFTIFLIFNIMLLLFTYFLLSLTAASGSSLIVTFTISFSGSVINLMNQRLLALIYMDLEYGTSDNKNTG